MDIDRLKSFKSIIDLELRENILKFWIDKTIDDENDGFYGYISNDLKVDKNHDKASVLYSRILWTFSAAYRIYRNESYLFMANRAYKYIVEHFLDSEYSGVYWMLDCKGNPANTKKQVYAIAFAIYAFSEYSRATGSKKSLEKAMELYEALEEHAYDKRNKGYIEAFDRDWAPIKYVSLSKKDMNTKKSMNTHLHVIEAYANLSRVLGSKKIKSSLKEIIEVTVEQIIDVKDYRFKLFFDEEWNSKSDIVSFGHDIEGSWLLYEAADALGDLEVIERVRHISLKMAQGVYEKGIDLKHGGIFNEAKHGYITDGSKDWWPQAEAVMGFFNAYQLTGSEVFLEASFNTWDFIEKNIIDRERGEWLWGVTDDGFKITSKGKIGPWKCPYHNSRMCIELVQRLDSIICDALVS